MLLIKFLLGFVVVQHMFFFSLMVDYEFMLMDQRLRIGFLSLSVCFICVRGFLCFSLLGWRLDEVIYDDKYCKRV